MADMHKSLEQQSAAVSLAVAQVLVPSGLQPFEGCELHTSGFWHVILHS